MDNSNYSIGEQVKKELNCENMRGSKMKYAEQVPLMTSCRASRCSSSGLITFIFISVNQQNNMKIRKAKNKWKAIYNYSYAEIYYEI